VGRFNRDLANWRPTSEFERPGHVSLTCGTASSNATADRGSRKAPTQQLSGPNCDGSGKRKSDSSASTAKLLSPRTKLASGDQQGDAQPLRMHRRSERRDDANHRRFPLLVSTGRVKGGVCSFGRTPAAPEVGFAPAGGAWARWCGWCARAPSLTSDLDPGWLRVGDMMVDGVTPEMVVRPLVLSGPSPRCGSAGEAGSWPRFIG
jgi:hypothetical protein